MGAVEPDGIPGLEVERAWRPGDAGYSVHDLASADAAATPAAADIRRLGLVGRPDYDLLRLHQAALDVEAQARTGSAIGAVLTTPPSDATRGELQRLRMVALEALRAAGVQGVGRLCLLAERHGLADHPLRLWGAEPTIPRVDAAACRR